MATHTLVFRNDRSGPANALQVIFAPRRGSLALRRIEPSSPQFLLEGRTLQAYFDKPLAPGKTVKLELEVDGIEPRPLAPTFLLASPSEWQRHQADVSGLSYGKREASREAIHEWREARAKAGPFSEFKHFFNAFDDATWEADPEFVLQRKLQAMLRARRRGNAQELRERRAAITVEELRPVSAGLKKSLRPLPLHKDLQPLSDAFERFARGELSMVEGDEAPGELDDFKGLACQPDSPLYFLLAELADACLEHGVEVELWGELRPTLVYTQACFYAAYSDGTLKPMLFGAMLEGLRPPQQTLPEAELRARRRAVLASRELDVLWRANLNTYLRF